MRITADNIFIDPIFLKKFIKFSKSSNADYVASRTMAHSPNWKLKSDYNFVLVIVTFYYEKSAFYLKNELVGKTKKNNFSVKKLSKNKYRLSVGPFKNFTSLKSTYISLNMCYYIFVGNLA